MGRPAGQDMPRNAVLASPRLPTAVARGGRVREATLRAGRRGAARERWQSWCADGRSNAVGRGEGEAIRASAEVAAGGRQWFSFLLAPRIAREAPEVAGGVVVGEGGMPGLISLCPPTSRVVRTARSLDGWSWEGRRRAGLETRGRGMRTPVDARVTRKHPCLRARLGPYQINWGTSARG